MFWCLKPAERAKLMIFQWENYGTHLKTPPIPSVQGHIEAPDYEEEKLEELDKFMRQPPHPGHQGSEQ